MISNSTRPRVPEGTSVNFGAFVGQRAKIAASRLAGQLPSSGPEQRRVNPLRRSLIKVAVARDQLVAANKVDGPQTRPRLKSWNFV
jgi:hypothetical protein